MAVNFVKADTFDVISDYEASTNLCPHFRHLLTDMDEIWYMRAAGNAAEWFLSFVKIDARKAVLILRHNVMYRHTINIALVMSGRSTATPAPVNANSTTVPH